MRRTQPSLQPLPSEITPPDRYFSRREVITALAAVGAVGAGVPRNVSAAPLKYARNPRFSLNEDANSLEDITTYNNFYEFGTDKADPAQNSGKFKPRPWSVAVAGECAKTGHLHAGRHPEAPCARGAHLSAALRRGLVDGDSVGRVPAGRPAEALRAQLEGQVRRVQDGACGRTRCPASASRCSTGPTSKACASTKPCTRWRCSPWDCTARPCPTRTAPRCDWSCPGSTASRASSRSSRSASPNASRPRRGTSPRPGNTASTPT